MWWQNITLLLRLWRVQCSHALFWFWEVVWVVWINLFFEEFYGWMNVLYKGGFEEGTDKARRDWRYELIPSWLFNKAPSETDVEGDDEASSWYADWRFPWELRVYRMRSMENKERRRIEYDVWEWDREYLMWDGWHRKAFTRWVGG